jgi:hypothetical protein
MKRLLGSSVLASTTLLLTSLHATADEIRVVRGTYFQTINTFGHLDVEGTGGLRIEIAQIPDFDAGLGWYECENLGCPPDDVVSLRAHLTLPMLNGGVGEVTVHGQTYPFGTLFSPGGARADLVFDPGTIVLPEFTDTAAVTLSAPFTFSGSVQVPNRHEPATYDVFELSGSGVATVYLVRHIEGTGWVVSNVTYDFEPRGNVTQR